ncbi:MAG: AhpC/TSA family protein [Acidobacteria bacterium]|nr:AhpC/TSA family protein [Acidobacteriota bacterium]
MRHFEKELQRLKVKVAVVTFEKNIFAQKYVEDTDLQWPLLADEKRELYHAYGMLRAGVLDLWGPASWWAYFKEMARGRIPKKPTGDVHQRGGDVLVDPLGIVRLHHVGQGPADRPAADALFRRIEIERERFRKKASRG